MPLTKIDLTEQVQNDLPASQVATSGDRQFLTTEEKNAATRSATSGQSGLMTSAQASKLDGISTNANNYTHPSSHPASIITQTSTNRFVTDAEKAKWNAKLDGSGNQSFDGNLTISGDLVVQGSTVTLDTETIALEDNLILLNKNQTDTPSPTLKSGIEIERGDKDNASLVFDESDEKWKISTDSGKTIKGIAAEDDSRFLTSAQKTVATRTASSSQEGLMSSSQASKLNGIAANANNYSLPAATASVRGGIKVGSSLSVSGDVLNVPEATPTVKGTVMIGSNIKVSKGLISVPEGSTSTKGVLSAGSNLKVSSGIISIPEASRTTKGVQKAILTERFTASGSTHSFILSEEFGTDTFLVVYRNGLRQCEGASDDYTRLVAKKAIEFTKVLKAGDKIVADYLPA